MSADVLDVPGVAAACPVCARAALEPFLAVSGIPVHVGVLWPSEPAARGCTRGDLDLAFCVECGHVTNTAFAPEALDYTQAYDNSLHGSSVFRDFEAELVETLTAGRDLSGGTVVEIGSGDGRFLRLLAAAGGCRAVGFEPGAGAGRTEGAVEIRGEEFRAGAIDGPVDLVCCRQVLEHLPEPRQVLEEVRRTLEASPGATAYFEVPNSDLFLADLSIWDLVYEHCQYFFDLSFRRLFEEAGLTVTAAWASYAGQFLSVLVTAATPAAVRSDDHQVARLREQVAAFGRQFHEKVGEWRRQLAELAASGARVALWGGGARAVAFANLVAAEGGLDLVVDVNPAKQGTFLAGTGHEIAGPERLLDLQPDVVIVLNPLYLDEIRAELASMGLDPEVRTP